MPTVYKRLGGGIALDVNLKKKELLGHRWEHLKYEISSNLGP
jgi:hypothetical protein